MPSTFECSAFTVVHWVLWAYILVMLAYALASWFPAIRGAWTNLARAVVEPVLEPVRRIVPPIGGFDISFLIVLLILNFVSNRVPVCYPY